MIGPSPEQDHVHEVSHAWFFEPRLGTIERDVALDGIVGELAR